MNFTGPQRINRAWPGLTVDYSWLPPFHGASHTRPNRLEVVFTRHESVALQQGQRRYDVTSIPGSAYIVGSEPTTLLNVGEHSDTLEIYPDLSLLKAAAEWENVQEFELQPTLRRQPTVTFARDPVALSLAHILRRACLDRLSLADVEASHLTHLLTRHLLRTQYGIKSPQSKSAPRLSDMSLRSLGDFIEDHLTETITLDRLAALVGMSPFHFARCFKNTTGLAPHQYVLARRIELAKLRLITSDMPVQDIAWSVGFENISHFRRKFVSLIGILPGALRKATRI